MKQPLAVWAGATAIALLTLGTDGLRADATNLVTVSVTMLLPGGTNVVRGIETIAAPKEYKISTQQILAWAAQDEYAEGNYGATNFPAGAKLVEVYDDQTGWSYQVVDSRNRFLVDVSDIVSSGSSSNSLYSGGINIATGVYATTVTDLRLMKFAYNDSAITTIPDRPTVGIDFYVFGLETRTFNDSAPTSAGYFTRTYHSQVSNGVGEGIWNGMPMLIEGGFQYSVVLQLRD